MSTKHSSTGLSATVSPNGATQIRPRSGKTPDNNSKATRATNAVTDRLADPLAPMRRLAQQGRELTKVVFGVAGGASEHPTLARRETAPEDLTYWEICAQLATYLNEPDGERLVQPVLAVLEHLNMTAEDEICDRLLVLAPELLAVLPGVAYDLPAALRLFLRYGCIDARAQVPCSRCGHSWRYGDVRSALWFEAFVWGDGCAACQPALVLTP